VTVSYHLEPLTAEETHAYVNHRLRHASIGAPLTFPRPVTDVIHANSRGVARTINIIADAVLLYGYGSDKRQIDLELTNEVVSDLGLTAGASQLPPSGAMASSVDVPDVALMRSPLAIEPTRAEVRIPIQIRPDPGMSADMPPDDTLLGSVHADLPLQASAAPAPVAPIKPGRRILSEAPPPQKSWWARFRRGASGHPRPAVEA
jgi:general secretion pathway protein A